MKNRCTLALVTMTMSVLYAGVANAATINVTSPGENNDIQANLQAAVNSAVDGDVIVLPSGHFQLTGVVNVTKQLVIKGNGFANTTLYRPESMSDSSLKSDTGLPAMFNFQINSASSSNIRVRGITFKSKAPSVVPGDNLSQAIDVGLLFQGAADFKVEACRFENFGNAAIVVKHADNLARGVIAQNQFYHNAKGDGLGYGYGVAVYGANQSWVSSPQFGTNNFIFIENNTFDYHRHAIAAGGAALYVARHNIITNNIIGANPSIHAIDAHEGRGGTLGTENYFSTRAVEVYKNTVVNDKFFNGQPITPGQDVGLLVERAILLRGGEGLIYSNKIDGYRFGEGVTAFEIPGESGYPIRYSVGYLSGLALGASHTGIDATAGNGDAFYWGNTFNRYKNANGTPHPQSYEFHNYKPQFLTNERDYHAATKPDYTAYQYPHPLQCATDITRDGQTSQADLG